MRAFMKIGAVAALAGAVACGDSTGPGALDQAEKTALGNALTASGALAGSPVSSYTALVINSLEEVGHMSGSASSQLARDLEASISAAVMATEYDAVGVVIDFDISGDFPITGAAAFVFGWNGLSTSGSPVSEMVSAGLVNLGSTGVPSGTRSIQGSTQTSIARGTYYDAGASAQYMSTSGSVTMSGSAFAGSATTCAGVETQTGVTCTVTTGTISGQFAFDAVNVQDANDTYSQSQINFADLPAVRISLTVSGQ